MIECNTRFHYLLPGVAILRSIFVMVFESKTYNHGISNNTQEPFMGNSDDHVNQYGKA